MKILKKAISLVMLLSFLLTFVRPLSVEAAPAPTLTKVTITDMCVEDTTGEIFVKVEYTGRPSTAKVTCNGYNCPEVGSYRRTLFSNNIEYGEVRYFKTPYTMNEFPGISSFIIYAEAQTLRYPRVTLYDNHIFPD